MKAIKTMHAVTIFKKSQLSFSELLPKKLRNVDWGHNSLNVGK